MRVPSLSGGPGAAGPRVLEAVEQGPPLFEEVLAGDAPGSVEPGNLLMSPISRVSGGLAAAPPCNPAGRLSQLLR